MLRDAIRSIPRGLAEGDENDGGGKEGGAETEGFQMRWAWSFQHKKGAYEQDDESDAERPKLTGRGGHGT